MKRLLSAAHCRSLFPLVLVVAVCAIYLPFLGSPFVFDDLPYFSSSVAQTTLFPHPLTARWVSYSTLDWTTAVFTNFLPQPFRLGSTALHALNAVLLYKLILRLLRHASVGQEQSMPAFFGAAYFACSPVAVYATGYVVERSILLATAFTLLLLHCYLRWEERSENRWLALSVLCYFLACYSKEHAVLAPALVLALAVVRGGTRQLLSRPFAVAGLAYAVIALLVVLSSRKLLGVAYEPLAQHTLDQIRDDGANLHLRSVLSQSGFFFYYLTSWIAPFAKWLAVDLRPDFIGTISDWRSWIGLFAFAAYGALGFRFMMSRSTRSVLGFAMLFPWLLFLVEFSAIRLQEPLVLYRSYLWMPGIGIALGLFVRWCSERLRLVKSRGNLSVIAASALVAILVVLCWNRLYTFTSSYRLWEDAAAHLKSDRQPGADRIYYNLGRAAYEEKKFDVAVANLEKTARISPNVTEVRYMLGVAYIANNEFGKARRELDTAIALAPTNGAAHFALARLLKRMGLPEEAGVELKEACRLKQSNACLIINFLNRRPKL